MYTPVQIAYALSSLLIGRDAYRPFVGPDLVSSQYSPPMPAPVFIDRDSDRA